MSKYENLEIKQKSPTFILYAPKLKFKKPTIRPTPFSLNDSESKEDFYSYDKDYDSYDEEDSNVINNLPQEDKNDITSYTVKIKRTIKQSIIN